MGAFEQLKMNEEIVSYFVLLIVVDLKVKVASIERLVALSTSNSIDIQERIWIIASERFNRQIESVTHICIQ